MKFAFPSGWSLVSTVVWAVTACVTWNVTTWLLGLVATGIGRAAG
jgi:hypothetical protein